MRPEEKVYRTKDLGEGAALVVSGQKIINIQREGNICWFVFEHSDSCKEISNQFFFGNLPRKSSPI